MKHRIAATFVLLLCLLSFIGARSDRTAAQSPRRLPGALRPVAGHGQPTVHVFVRSGCRACDRHLQALDTALLSLPDSLQQRLCNRILRWEVGTAGHSRLLRRSPLTPSRLGIRATPVTWFVGRGDSIRRRWCGSRADRTWRRALLDLEQEMD